MNKDFKESEVLARIKLVDSNIENKVRCALLSSKSQTEKCDLLMDLIQNIPTKLWLELAVGCINELSVNGQKKICKQIIAIFKEGELFTKSDSIEILKKIEEKAISIGLNGMPLLKIIPYSASFLNRAIRDNRYKLFADYGHVYYTTDIGKLKSAVVELNELCEKGGSPEAARSYAYLLTISQFRLAHLLYPQNTVSETILSRTYDDCVDNNNDYNYDNYYDDDDDDDDDDGFLSDDLWSDNSFSNMDNESYHYISDIANRILNYGCVEIARIFDPYLYYIDADLLKKIHRAVMEVSDRNRYENEIAPIVEKNCLFVINPDN